MYEPRFELIPEQKSQPRSAQLWQRMAVVAVAVLLLVLAGVYGPLLINNTPAAATPALTEYSVAATGAQRAQIDVTSLFEDQEALANLYEQVTPSVVNIQVTSRASTTAFPGFGSPDQAPLQQSQGSGFIYDDQGHIVTNNHVVEDAEEVLVVFHNGFWAEAEVVATDPQADLAVIKVTPPSDFEWRPLPLAEPITLRVGHTVIVIGNPFGLDGTMTTGIVSAVGRGLPVGDAGAARYTLPDVIQTDAAINPGNSGGPLLNLNGEVVGVNFAIESPVRSNSGVGFAIPVSIVRRVVPALIAEGRYEYAYLGLSGSTISPGLARQLDLPNNLLGIYVAGIVAGGPSEAAGIQGATQTITTDEGAEIQIGGDIVIAIDGVPVRRFEDLVSYLVTETEPGASATLTILRDDKEIAVDVVLGSRPGQPGGVSQREPQAVNARQAIEVATKVVEDGDMLDGPIVEKLATPDERDGTAVWVVELSSASKTATVVVEQATGDVIEVTVR